MTTRTKSAPARGVVGVKEFETWRSTIEGEIWLKQWDRRGDEIATRVQAGKEIRILPEERKLNQDLTAEDYLDPFMNGMLVPVQLVETADDFEELQGNPNHLTENDMRGLLDDPKAIDALKAGLEPVTNSATLARLLAIAEDPETDATLRQVSAIRDRLQQLQQRTDYEEVETVGAVTSSEGKDVLGTKAPPSPAPFNPTMGRRR